MSDRAPTAAPEPRGDTDGVRRVLVVDDHRTFTDLLGRAIAAEPDLAWVGAAHTVEDALHQTRALAPHAVVMDVQVGPGDGLEATRSLVTEHPDLRVVVLTAFATQSLMHRAVDVGAHALLPKDGGLDDLLAALREDGRDGFQVHPTLLRRLLDRPAAAASSEPPVHLTGRESEVLHLLAAGLDPSSIAKRLGISRHTSRGYVAALLGKLDAHTQLEAVAVARRKGLLHEHQ
ncbi:response regulator transcription factor [Phycicoccus avicenniae]|uniref:response regulator transcription factor n=1 Tax=Phycicoccus avicenniae TaxID=2828860 RepID=UPI003D2E8194